MTKCALQMNSSQYPRTTLTRGLVTAPANWLAVRMTIWRNMFHIKNCRRHSRPSDSWCRTTEKEVTALGFSSWSKAVVVVFDWVALQRRRIFLVQYWSSVGSWQKVKFIKGRVPSQKLFQLVNIYTLKPVFFVYYFLPFVLSFPKNTKRPLSRLRVRMC